VQDGSLDGERRTVAVIDGAVRLCFLSLLPRPATPFVRARATVRACVRACGAAFVQSALLPLPGGHRSNPLLQLQCLRLVAGAVSKLLLLLSFVLLKKSLFWIV
jgi:hypothetical protein